MSTTLNFDISRTLFLFTAWRYEEYLKSYSYVWTGTLYRVSLHVQFKYLMVFLLHVQYLPVQAKGLTWVIWSILCIWHRNFHKIISTSQQDEARWLLVGTWTSYVQSTQARGFVKPLYKGCFRKHLYRGWVFVKHPEGALWSPYMGSFVNLGFTSSIHRELCKAPIEVGASVPGSCDQFYIYDRNFARLVSHKDEVRELYITLYKHLYTQGIQARGLVRSK